MQHVLALDEGSAELRRALDTGTCVGPDGRELAARPVRVRSDGKVELELFEPMRRGGAGAWIAAVRPPSLTATFTPVLATYLYGLGLGWAIDVPVAVMALVGVLALQVAVNLLNDVEDHRRLIDLPGTLGGAGLIQGGALSARSVRRAAIGAALLGLALGVPAFLRDPAAFAVIGALAVIGGLGYSSGPGLKYRALGDLSVIALCGPVLTAGASLAAFGRVDAFTLVMGAALGFAAVGLLHVNNFQDGAADRARGVRTLALALGDGGSRAYLIAVYALAFATWAVAASLSALPLWLAPLPALAAIPAVGLVRRLLAAPDPAAFVPARMQAAATHLVFGVLICLALGVAMAI